MGNCSQIQGRVYTTMSSQGLELSSETWIPHITRRDDYLTRHLYQWRTAWTGDALDVHYPARKFMADFTNGNRHVTVTCHRWRTLRHCCQSLTTRSSSTYLSQWLRTDSETWIPSIPSGMTISPDISTTQQELVMHWTLTVIYSSRIWNGGLHIETSLVTTCFTHQLLPNTTDSSTTLPSPWLRTDILQLESHPSQAEWHLNRYLKHCNKARHNADIGLFPDSVFLLC